MLAPQTRSWKWLGNWGGGEAGLLLAGKNIFFPLGTGHHATQGLAILTPKLLSLEPKALKLKQRGGWDYGF